MTLRLVPIGRTLIVAAVLGCLLFSFMPMRVAAQDPERASGSTSPRIASSGNTPSGEVPSVSAWAGSLGVFTGYGINFHKTQTLIWQNCPTCGEFAGGTGGGLVLGLFGTLPFLTDRMNMYASIGYAQRGGTFGTVYTGGLPILDPNTNQYVTLQRKNESSANLGFFTLDLGLQYQPLPNVPLYARATISVDPALGSNSSYHQTEQILAPQGVVYPETHTTTRDVANGVIQGIRTPFGASGAIGYRVPLLTGITAAPEVRYYLPFSPVVSAYSWTVRSLELGIAFRYAAPAITPVEAPELPPPFVNDKKLEPIRPTATLTTLSATNVKIVETIVTETFPVLPYVFFDSAGSELPVRYKKLTPAATGSFSELDLPHHSLEAYHNVLNVVGARMAHDTSYRLVLNGTTDGREAKGDSNAAHLALARAQTIKDYLTSIWQIAPERITVTESASPAFPSTTEFPQGIEENRRVELSSPNDELLRPILHERFKEHAVQPPEVPFVIQTQHPTDVDRWKMDVEVRGTSVWQASGTGTPPQNVVWQLDPTNTARVADALSGKDSLACLLTVTSKEGLSATSRTAIASEKSVNPFELSRLSLIVFDFDKSEITPQNQRMISHFVAHSILDSSKSTIIGSTDNLGEAKHNQQLSEGRAFAVRDLILADRGNTQITKTEGVGAARQVYSNDLPEGRYYCRTVTVEVETPLSAILPPRH